MCWIFWYIWNDKAINYLLNWLKSLEYRWYDSSWLIMLNNNKEIYFKRALWRVSNLSFEIENDKNLDSYNLWISHTRWATHWKVTLKNTHPHHSQNNRFFLVHNWIIENYIDLKKKLENEWYKFYSETDSEVIANLIEFEFENNLEFTLKKIVKMIIWAYALVVIDTEKPDQIIWLKLWSPLVLGISEKQYFLASDLTAISNVTDKYIPIDDNEMIVLSRSSYKIISSWKTIIKDILNTQKLQQESELGNFNHFMEKEIFEIPDIIENVLWWKIDYKTKEITSKTLEKIDISSINKIEIIASWTSYNAWLEASYLFEDLSWIQTQVFVSTEYKYKKQFINKNTLYVFISQSWETADTLECLKIVKKKWWQTFWIVNVVWSSIARMCDNWLYTHCWVEIWVAATKTFIWQLLILMIMSLYFWIKNNLDYNKYCSIIDNLYNLKNNINYTLINSSKIKKIAKKYSIYNNMFFLWRNLFYPIAMEWSLKCKEITYLHTESYSAWELKHWPLSLIDENFPSIIINPTNFLYEKNISSLKEIQARNGSILWIISSWDINSNLYDDIIEVYKTDEYNSIFTVTVTLQLFAYYLAFELWKEIDKPRNLAKSVTVE